MRRPLSSSLKLTAGILLVVGCSNGSSGLGPKAGAAAGVATTGPSLTGGAQADASGALLTGGETGTLTSTGGKAGGAGSLASTLTSGIAGTSGAPSSLGGSRTGSPSAAGGGGASAGTSAAGGAPVAGQSSAASGGTTGSTTTSGTTATAGTSATGGTTAAGGTTATSSSRSGPPFPARFVGNLDTRGSIRADFPLYWDQFTPENAGKWAAVQGGGRDSFNWKSLDTFYKYAEENNLVFKEHCFIWGPGQANWINNDNVVEAAKTWMKTFCDRYPKTRLIDVVNEPLHKTPTYAQGLREGGSGFDWVANSFKMAREACPNAILILNEYNNCEYSDENQKIIDLANTAKAQGAPIDAIGCQGHDAAKVKLSVFKGYLDKIISETGLPVYITEYDIGLADDEAQRAQYADYFTMFWDNPNVKGVTIWGYIQGATWRDNTHLMNTDGSVMRPAMTWLMDFLKR